LEEYVTAFESRLTAIEHYIVDMEAHRRDTIGRGDRYEPELRAAIRERWPDD
jgi:hypothetical protein